MASASGELAAFSRESARPKPAILGGQRKDVRARPESGAALTTDQETDVRQAPASIRVVFQFVRRRWTRHRVQERRRKDRERRKKQKGETERVSSVSAAADLRGGVVQRRSTHTAALSNVPGVPARHIPTVRVGRRRRRRLTADPTDGGSSAAGALARFCLCAGLNPRPLASAISWKVRGADGFG